MQALFRIPVVIVLLALVAPLTLRAADDDETPLGEQMEKMKTEMKALRSALEAPAESARNKYVKMAESFHAAAEAAKKFEPEKTKTLPEAERAQFVTDYHKAMDKLIKLSGDLKKDLAAGQWDEARKHLKALSQAQKAGHKEFRIHKD